MKTVIKKDQENTIMIDNIDNHGLAVAVSNDHHQPSYYFLAQVDKGLYQWMGLAELSGEFNRQEFYVNRHTEKKAGFGKMVSDALEGGWQVMLPESKQEFLEWLIDKPLN